MRFVITLCLTFLVSISHASDYFPIRSDFPDELLTENNFQVQSSVVHSSILKRDVVRVSVFCKFKTDEVLNSLQDVDKRLLDFKKWPVYSSLPSGSLKKGDPDSILKANNLYYLNSETWKDTNLYDSPVFVHHADYYIKAPFFVYQGKMHIDEYVIYKRVSVQNGAKVNWRFFAHPDYQQTGIKYKEGWISVFTDSDSKEVDTVKIALTVDVIPALDVMLSLSVPFIQNAITQVYRGMFIEYLGP